MSDLTELPESNMGRGDKPVGKVHFPSGSAVAVPTKVVGVHGSACPRPPPRVPGEVRGQRRLLCCRWKREGAALHLSVGRGRTRRHGTGGSGACIWGQAAVLRSAISQV